MPNGKTLDYGYDNLGRLITVKRPGFGVKTYIYDEADKAPNDNPNLLTGIIDEMVSVMLPTPMIVLTEVF